MAVRRITREKLREAAENFLKILDVEEVGGIEDLKKLAGQTIPVRGREQDYVMISWRPSNFGTRAIDASYVIHHRQGEVEGGIPLDLKMNPSIRYSQIIIKTESGVEGYEAFFKDFFGNIIQARFLPTLDWGEVREVVGRLAED